MFMSVFIFNKLVKWGGLFISMSIFKAGDGWVGVQGGGLALWNYL